MGAVVLALLFCGAEQTRAATITFEDLGVAPGTQLNPASGIGVVSGGFNYTPGPNNSSGLNDLHISNAETNIPIAGIAFNGTTIGGTHDDVILTKVGSGTFSIQSFDFAGYPFIQNNEVLLG